MRRKRLTIMLFATSGVVGAVLIVLWLYCPTTLYRVSFLPFPKYGPVTPESINDRGQVVGVIAGYFRHRADSIFLWEPGRELQDLGSFGSPACVGSPRINNAGQIGATVRDSDGTWRALVWDPNTGPQLLGTLGGTKDEVQALNNRSQLVGSSQTPAGLRHAVLWDGGAAVVDLGTLGGPESLACSINDSGQVAGFSQIASGGWHAFFWDPNTGMRDLGATSLAAPKGGEIHVNNSGLVVGRFGAPTDPRLICTWCESAGSQPLVSVPGIEAYPMALNDAGQLLTEVRSTGFDLEHVHPDIRIEYYLWDPDYGLVLLRRHLGRRGIHGLYPCDIDNKGQIVALLQLKKSAPSRLVLLDPVARRDKMAHP